MSRGVPRGQLVALASKPKLAFTENIVNFSVLQPSQWEIKQFLVCCVLYAYVNHSSVNERKLKLII